MIPQLRKKLLAQALLALSQVAFPLVTYPVITRALGAENLGRINFTDSLLQFFLVVGSLGIPVYGLREIAVRRDQPVEQSKVFWGLLRLQGLLLVPVLAGFWLIATLSEVPVAYRITALVSLTAGFLSCEWFLQGNEKFEFLAYRSIIIRGMAVLAIFLFIHTPSDALLYYFILCGSVVAIMILNFSYIIGKVSKPMSPLALKEKLTGLNWVFGCYVLASLYGVMDSLLLGWLSDEAVVGYYSFGYRMIRMSAMIIPAMGAVFIPQMAFHHAGNRKELVKEGAGRSLQLILFLGWPITIFFFVLAPEIVGVFSGGSFVRSIPVLQVLCAVPLLISLSHLAGSQVLLPVRKERVYFLLLLVGFCLNIVLDLVFIPRFEERAAAWSNLAAEAFVAASATIFLYRKGLLPIDASMIVMSLAGALLMWPVAMALRRFQLPPIGIITGTVLLSGGAYLLLFVKVFPRSFVSQLLRFRYSGDI